MRNEGHNDDAAHRGGYAMTAPSASAGLLETELTRQEFLRLSGRGLAGLAIAPSLLST